MKKINTSAISGTQELLPSLQAEFDRLKSGILHAFLAHGFIKIETPIIDRTEILLAKAGGDTEKQIYKVVKTAETADQADQALRFDHTVPLARYTVEHMNELAFPFKATQVARNFRGERPQKGRFREFYQCDVDVIGWEKLPIAYDTEIIMTLADAMLVLPIPRFLIRVSNRKLLTGLLEGLNLQQWTSEIFNIVDHAEKVPPEATREALENLGIGSENVVKITTFTQIRGKRAEVIPKLESLGSQNETFEQGVRELETVMAELERRLENEAYASIDTEADMVIVRGLDYYTGTVFETVAPDYREIGSICSGGRYADLAGYYTDQHLPGVGGSIGLSRLFYILRNYGLIDNAQGRPVDIAIVPISENEYTAAQELAVKLRSSNKSVDVVLTDKRLGDKLTYAAKIANFAIVVGEDEAKSGDFKIKNLQTGEIADLVSWQ